MNVAIESSQAEEHICMIQSIIDTCLHHTELHDELYCQLIVQTSKHPPQQKTAVQVGIDLITRGVIT